jgi:multisubunit Na+/H+ antiporter MnhE subunit
MSARTPLRASLRWVAWWAALMVLYLALVDTRQYPELVLGGVVAAVGATAARAVRNARPLPPLPLRTLARHLPGALLRLILDTAIVFRFAARRLRGSTSRGTLIAVPFRSGGDGAEDVARRALTESLGSMGPNQIVIGIDRERNLLVVHQLARDPERADLLELG